MDVCVWTLVFESNLAYVYVCVRVCVFSSTFAAFAGIWSWFWTFKWLTEQFWELKKWAQNCQ